MSTEPLLSVTDLHKSFDGVKALKGVSFAVEAGEFHALLGENGAGKSTLIKIVSGVFPASDGDVRWRGQQVRFGNPQDARELGIGVVHQEETLIGGLSVVENFALGRDLDDRGGRVAWRQLAETVRAQAAEVGLGIDPNTRVSELTVAERKRVAILRTLAASPDLLILDEPTAALTATEVERLMTLLTALKRRGVAILYVTHRLKEIELLVDRVTVLKDGEKQATLRRDEASQERILSLMVGRDVGELFPASAYSGGRVVLNVRGLCQANAFDDVNLTVHEGEIVGLVGLDGHGHFHTARALFGNPPADQGEIRVGEHRVSIPNPAAAVAAGLGFVSEDRIGESVLTNLSVRENLGIATLRLWSRSAVLKRKAENEGVAELTRLLGIKAASPESAIETLSGGNQQKVMLARWFAGDLRVLVLLDPTAGVDVGARVEIYRVLNRMAQRGAAIVLATSDLSEALGLCDHLHVFYKGTVRRTLSRDAYSEAHVLAAMTGQTEVAA